MGQRIRVINKETWVSLLAAAGFNAEDTRRRHVEFERLAPDKHVRFLKFLGTSEDEIQAIRAWASRPEG